MDTKLREKIAEIICNALDISWSEIGKHTKSEYLENADHILSLFTQQAEAIRKEGKDYFDFNKKVDWVFTNPPWNKVTPFLEHSLEIANDICFLIVLQQLWTKKRLRLIKENGFGIKEICYFKEPDNFPHLGIQIGMVHISRGYQGGIILTDLDKVSNLG